MSNDLISRRALLEDLMEQIPLAENVQIFKEIIEEQPTAYDVDKVVEQINQIGKSVCDSVKCDENCADCDHGSIMRAVTKKVEGGGVE